MPPSECNGMNFIFSFGYDFYYRISNIPSSECKIKALESKASWCEQRDDMSMQNICDGTKMDCITKARSLCLNEPSCLGFMWNSGWGSVFKGVQNCTSSKLTAKTEKDWEIYLKKCINSF